MADFGYSDAHAGIAIDERRKALLKDEGKTPCVRCEGTGNELYAMYKRCQECGGSGEQSESNAKAVQNRIHPNRIQGPGRTERGN